MHVDFRAPGAWSSLNEKAAKQLGLNLDKTATRVYRGVGHALIEVMWGLAKLFPNRKKIYYFKNMDPTFDSALISFAKEGYQLTALDLSVLSSGENFVNGLVAGGGSAREDLFVLYSCDEPLLGRAYEVTKFEAAIKAAGLFKIRVSHARHFYEGSGICAATGTVPAAAAGTGIASGLAAGVASGAATTGEGLLLDRNWAYIYSLAPHQALALLGERGKIGALTADQLPMPFDEKLELDWFKKPQILNRDTVLSFEASRVADARTFFTPQELRVADRAVIYWDDMDGHAVIDRLAARLGFVLREPGYESRLETTSLSRWGGVRTMDFLKLQMAALGWVMTAGAGTETEFHPSSATGLSTVATGRNLPDYANILRGLVMIGHELINADVRAGVNAEVSVGVMSLETHLCAVRKSILRDQNG